MQEPNYPEVVTAFSLMPAAPMPENTVMDHVAFAPYPVTALDAPVTEMAILTLKEGQDAKVLNEELAKLAKALDAAKGAHPPCSFGASRQRPEHNVLLVGWENVQVGTIRSRLTAYVDRCKLIIGTSRFCVRSWRTY